MYLFKYETHITILVYDKGRADRILRFEGRESGSDLEEFVQDKVPIYYYESQELGVRRERGVLKKTDFLIIIGKDKIHIKWCGQRGPPERGEEITEDDMYNIIKYLGMLGCDTISGVLKSVFNGEPYDPW